MRSKETYTILTAANTQADPLSPSSFSISLSSKPELEAEGLHLQTWGSSYILANLLHRLDGLPSVATTASADPCTSSSSSSSSSLSSSFQVLELGAGTGLVGLSAAVLWKTRVLLTDLPSILPGIAANIALNQKLLQEYNADATCGALDWRSPFEIILFSSPSFTPSHLLASSDSNHTSFENNNNNNTTTTTIIDPAQESQKPLLILAADTMYTEEHPALLTYAIHTWLRHDASARAVVCYPMRVAYLDYMREFWLRMSDAGLEAVSEGREMVDEKLGFDDERLHEWCVWRWKESREFRDDRQ
jgi:predicted nicotinamide N-methyase